MTRVAVVGATGYAGRELLELCKRHPGIESITAMSAREGGDPAPLDARAQWTLMPLDLAALGRDHDVVFTCLPHTVGVPVAKAALDGPRRPRSSWTSPRTTASRTPQSSSGSTA